MNNSTRIGHIPRCQLFSLTQITAPQPSAHKKCFNCGENHEPIRCTENTGAPRKCANCQGNHIGNYRGCIYYLEDTPLRKMLSLPTTTVPEPGAPFKKTISISLTKERARTDSKVTDNQLN
jgi:hypothetical protein